MYVCVDVWYGWMDGWMDGLMEGGREGWMDASVCIHIYIYIYVSVCRLLVCNSVLSRHCSCTILLFVPVIGSSILLRLGGGGNVVAKCIRFRNIRITCATSASWHMLLGIALNHNTLGGLPLSQSTISLHPEPAKQSTSDP